MGIKYGSASRATRICFESRNRLKSAVRSADIPPDVADRGSAKLEILKPALVRVDP